MVDDFGFELALVPPLFFLVAGSAVVVLAFLGLAKPQGVTGALEKSQQSPPISNCVASVPRGPTGLANACYKNCGLDPRLAALSRAGAPPPQPWSVPDLALEQQSSETFEELSKSGLIQPDELPKLRELTAMLAGSDVNSRGGDGGWMRVGNPRTMLRYLRARQGHVANAAEMFRNSLAFRKLHGVDDVKQWDSRGFDLLAPYWVPAAVLLHDRDGDPCFYMRLGKADVASLNRLEFDAVLKNEMRAMENLVRSLHWHSERRREQGQLGKSFQITVISDLSGLGTQHLNAEALERFGRLVKISSDHYPEIMKRCIVVNAPRIFASIWYIAENFFDQRQRDKIKIVSAAKTSETLRSVIEEENIPAYLGGPLCVFGDGECCSVIPPGGPIPPGMSELISKLIVEATTAPTRALGCERLAMRRHSGIPRLLGESSGRSRSKDFPGRLGSKESSMAKVSDRQRFSPRPPGGWSRSWRMCCLERDAGGD